MSIVQAKTLYFTPKAWVQMWRLTAACDIEISALGLLLPGRDDVVQEFYVPKQKCSPTYTEMLDTELSEMQMALSAEGVDTSRLRVFFHSHVNMAATPSGTDEATIDRLANGAFLWSIITNKDGAAAALSGKEPGKGFYLRLDTYDPVNHTNAKSVYRNTTLGCSFSVLYHGLVTNKWVEESLGKVDKMTYQNATTMQGVSNWQQWVNSGNRLNQYQQRTSPSKVPPADDGDYPVWFNHNAPTPPVNDWRAKQMALEAEHLKELKKEKEVEKLGAKAPTDAEPAVDALGYWERTWLY